MQKLINNRKFRFLTATSLFDGHDVSINIIRRILVNFGVEVIHIGHNKSATDVVNAAIQEDVDAIAISSYQGGHNEYFSYIKKLLNEKNRENILIFGGGGGVISSDEIKKLHKIGITRIFSIEDGQNMKLEGMIKYMINKCILIKKEKIPDQMSKDSLPKILTLLESSDFDSIKKIEQIYPLINEKSNIPILGFTGPGGAGKSSLIDEIVTRYLNTFKDKNIAILNIDPSKKKTGGALLGDRIRFNSANNSRVFIRSIATREKKLSSNLSIKNILNVFKLAKFDLIILETAGTGQSDCDIKDLVDISLYIMTSEYGAPTQLEKISMLDFADFIVVNKFDKPGSTDTISELKKHTHYSNNNALILGTNSRSFNDLGINTLFNKIFNKINNSNFNQFSFKDLKKGLPSSSKILSKSQQNYLNKIILCLAEYHLNNKKQIIYANKANAYSLLLYDIKNKNKSKLNNLLFSNIYKRYIFYFNKISINSKKKIKLFSTLSSKLKKYTYSYTVRNRIFQINNFTSSLSHLHIPKISLPLFNFWGHTLNYLNLENLPGIFPFTSGVFPFKREEESPTRMFAGEGIPEKTNKRFHLLAFNQNSVRLSTAFDSPTLYGADPSYRPDVFGKIGNSGVSISSLDDTKRLYSGFNLSAQNTSVSMTINGPAPIILAFFFNTAIDAECERVLRAQGLWNKTKIKINKWLSQNNINKNIYRHSSIPNGHNKSGLGFLGVPASFVLDPLFYNKIKKNVLKTVRGTVQADILKEDQAQNTCIFSTEFSLKLMGDIQEYFNQNSIKNFYSVSLSGYHIAEAGANPLTQLSFTLANGFTLVEYYKNRGMNINDFAKNLSFFFSNGLDPEYTVIGRVARRIWSIAIKYLYNGNSRSQKLKYHIQTSGRSLHSQEIDFNDIRTTLQALQAISDNCNSLHTNAYNEAITTPTEESVRRALAIQMIINQELGYSKNENPLQGSFFIEYLTNLVEKNILYEFQLLNSRGGVLNAMELMYQRNKIQENSLYYETKKHSGEIPIIGVNIFKNDTNKNTNPSLIRSTTFEKKIQVNNVFQKYTNHPISQKIALTKLKNAALNEENIFSELMNTVKYCSLESITNTLYKVGGSYRRNM